MKRHTAPSAVLAALVLLAATPAAAASPIDSFVGNYVGSAEYQEEGEDKKRDLSVEIRKASRGFTVSWTTVIPKEGDRTVTRKFKIRFVEAPRKHLYRAGMRTDVFGKLVPLDPLKGDPFFWAALRGKTFTVFGMLVADDGGWELQIYHRTLTPGGMSVKFQRFRNGKQLRDISGTLKKVK